MKHQFAMGSCAVAACMALGNVHAQTDTTDSIVVTGKREKRISKGATGLPLELKDTPQTISVIDKEDIADYGATGSNDALRLGTGINVEQYETNRAVYNARGFEIQLTQIDGLGMSNDWGTVVGQSDTFLFDRIELIRGANGLLTGVGNASGTINYVRKRPTNKDGGEVSVSAGSYGLKRAALDYNKVLTQDGAWAGRVVVASEDKDSHLRDLNDKRSTVYGVVDGQIGDNGVLTVGVTLQDAKQKSPMWGSLTLNYVDGTQADFDASSSTSQQWTFWNTKSQSAFVEYTHSLSPDWEAKLTYNHRRGEEETRLLYAFSFDATGGLNLDNTGLYGWPYGSYTTTRNDIVDANVNGRFTAWGLQHSLIAGLSVSRQKTETDLFNYDTATYQFLPLPAFPYTGDVYPEPEWGPRTPDSGGKQQLTRFYVAAQLGLTERLKGLVGLNAIKLHREGSSRYGDTSAPTTDYPDTKELSPYLGLTYDISTDVLGYVSYSDIFQNQDQKDFDGNYLDPMKGVNAEAGVKAEWLDRKLLTTFALFTSRQNGLAIEGPGQTADQQFWYFPMDVKSKGFEFEASGRIGKGSKITLGYTRLKLDGAEGDDTAPWIPRSVVNFRVDTEVLPKLRMGMGGRWQSDVHSLAGVKQDAYLYTSAFAAYQLTDAATLRLTVNNLFDTKYIGGLAYGAIYGAPRNAAITLDYKL